MVSFFHKVHPIIWICLAGLILRLYRYTSQSIWLDETISIYIAMQSFLDVITFMDPTPPLFYILLHFWIMVSSAEWWLKLLPVIVSTLTIFFTYKVAEKLYSHKIGIIASLFVMLSPIHVFYAQELRAYALLFFVTTAVVYFYLQFDFSYKHKLWYVLFFISVVYTHLFGLFVLCAIQVHRFVTRRKDFFRFSLWMKYHIFLTILTIPWFVQIYRLIQHGEAGWIIRPSLSRLGEVVYLSFGGVSAFMITTLTVVVCVILVLLAVWQKKIRFEYYWILIPVLLPFLASFILKPFFYPRYALLVSIPLFILIAHGVSRMRYKTVLICIVSLLLLSSTLLQAHSVTKDPWDEIIVERPVGFIAYYEAFSYIYIHERDCFFESSIDEVYVCASKRGIYGIMEDYPPPNLSSLVLSKDWLTQSDRQLASEYVPANATRIRYEINTDVWIFTNNAMIQPIYVVFLDE